MQRRKAYCLLLVIILIILIQMPLQSKIAVKAQRSDAVITEPDNAEIVLQKGEYYILKANITNNGTETIHLKRIVVQRSDITQIINTTYPFKWLMPSNETYAFILINTSALEPATYYGCVNFTFEGLSGEIINTVNYSITVQPSSPLIRINPPYFYFEGLSYEESLVKIVVESLTDTNLTVLLQLPNKLSEICTPLKDKDVIPPRGHAEFPLLIRTWKTSELIVEEMNFTVISPVSQTWRVPVVIVPHETWNIQNYTLLEKHVILENDSITVENNSIVTVNFNVPMGVHQLIVGGDSTSLNYPEWILYDPTGTPMTPIGVEFVKFIVRDPGPGQWTILLNNTAWDSTENVTIKVLVSASDMIGGTDLLKEKLVVQGRLLSSEEKVFRLYIPPGVSSLNIRTERLKNFLIELYDPFGNLIREIFLTDSVLEPVHGTYTIRIVAQNLGEIQNITFSMEIETLSIEEFSEIPVIVTDFLRSEESKIFKFYVPPGVEAIPINLDANGSIDCTIESPSGEKYLLPEINVIKNPEHGIWSLFFQAGENVTFTLTIDEAIGKLLGAPPFQVTGRLEDFDLEVFRFYISTDTEKFVLNGSSSGMIEWTLMDPKGEIQYSLESTGFEDLVFEDPMPGAWELELYSIETAEFSFEVVVDNYNFSYIKMVLPDECLLLASGDKGSDIITIQNIGNDTLEIVSVENLDPWVNISSYNPSEILPSWVGSIDFELNAKNCSSGIYHSFIVIRSSWGVHFVEVSMKVLIDLVKIRDGTEILVSKETTSTTLNIYVQNIGVSYAGIKEVQPSYQVRPGAIYTGNISIIKVEKSGLTEGVHYILPNITISFGTTNIMSFFVPIVIVNGRPYAPNFAYTENLEITILQNDVTGRIDEPILLSINVTNVASSSTGKVILWEYGTNDLYLLPASEPFVENNSFTILDTNAQFVKWMKGSIRLMLIVESSDGELACVTSKNALNIDIKPGITVEKVWYLPENPLAHDHIAINVKLGSSETKIFSIAVFYIYDNHRKTLFIAEGEGSNVYSGMLNPFMEPVNVSFIVSTVTNGRIGFLISDNDGEYYNINVKTSPPPELFSIYITTDRPAYQSGSRVIIWGNLTRGGSPLVNVFLNIEVRDPAKDIIVEKVKATNGTGYFTLEIDLPENATEGIYYVNITYGGIQKIHEFWVDNTPPTIMNIIVTPEKPHVGDEITIEVRIQDNESGIGIVILSYNYGDQWINITMSGEEGLYSAILPPMDNEGSIRYKIYVLDIAGNVAYSEEQKITVTKPATLPGGLTLIIGSIIVVTVVVVVIILKRRK